MGKKKTWKNIKRAFPLYIMVAPGFLYLLINNYVPMTGIIIAFKHLNFAKGILHSDWAGLSNFEYLFKTPDAALITRNTLLYNFAFIVVNTTVSILIALLLSELRSKTKVKIFQSAVLIPSLISIIIVSYLVYALLGSTTGFVNNTILNALGKKGVDWYTAKTAWPFILVIVYLWKNAGYNAIVYMAGIAGIDKEIYEAAKIDGASKLKQITAITLPLLRPTIIIMTLMAIGRVFYSDFGLFYQVPMNAGTLFSTTQTIDTYVYRGLMDQGNVGMSSAAGVYQSLVGFALVMIANFIVRKKDPENALF